MTDPVIATVASAALATLALKVPVLCTGAVFWMHSKKQKPDETSQLRQMLWGIQFHTSRMSIL